MNISEPLISLIIPVYNVKPYLRHCLDSAIAQSYKNLEILIVDDGSTDGCSEICDEYGESDDSNIMVFHTENRGLSAARNYGLDHMSDKTRFVSFLDSDDWLEPDALQKLFDAVIDSNADIASALYYIEEANSQSVNDPLNHKVIMDGDRVLPCLLKEPYVRQTAWNKLYKAELFSSIRYPLGMIFEDVATTYKLFSLAQKVVVISDALYHYRVRDNSLSREWTMKALTDCWYANYARYSDLSEKLHDFEALHRLTGDCLLAINRMWRGYGGFTKEERTEGQITIIQMKKFAKERLASCFTESGYTKLERFTCILSLSSNPVLLQSLNKLNNLFCFIKRKKHYN